MGDISGVACYLDDIVVTGKYEQEDLTNLQKTMQHLNTTGLPLKLDKCHFFQDSITYLGHIVEGVWPHPDKIKVIAEIPEPNYKNQAELCYFLGMVNYYDCFVPAGLATTCTCAPLNSI